MNWEKGYQTLVCRGTNKSRLDFLIETSQAKLQGIDRQHQIACENEEVLTEKSLTDEVYWKSLLTNAKELKTQRERRKRFIVRHSKKGKPDPIEAALFDLVNPSPMTFTDISTISRSKSTSNQEGS